MLLNYVFLISFQNELLIFLQKSISKIECENHEISDNSLSLHFKTQLNVR
jgi:hypothetical protein